MVPQAARWRQIKGLEVRARLEKDERPYEVRITWQGGFWTYWGNPAYDALYGTLCFGDLELKRRHSLLASALPRAVCGHPAGALPPIAPRAAPPAARPCTSDTQATQAPFTPHPTAQGLKRARLTARARWQQWGPCEIIHRPFFIAGGHAAALVPDQRRQHQEQRGQSCAQPCAHPLGRHPPTCYNSPYKGCR